MSERERADRSTRAEVDARCAEVAEIMARGKWSRAMCAALAKKYDVAPRTVRDYARIASRVVWSGSDDDINEIQAGTIAKLEMLALKAETAGELRTAVSALAEMAKIAGACAPQRVAVSGTLNHTLEALPPAMRVEVQAIEDGDPAAAKRFAGLDVAESWRVALASGWTAAELMAVVAPPMLGEGKDVGNGE